MKFILLVTFLFSVNTQAKNWVKKSAIKNPAKVWSLRSKCEAQESETCFNISKKDLRRFKMGLVDDLDAPNLRAVEDSPVKVDCDDFADCQTKAMGAEDDGAFPDRVCLADAGQERWDELANHPGVTGVTGPWFYWCEKPDGTFQKKDALVADAAGSAAADAADAAKAAEKATRDSKRTTRRTDASACVTAVKGGGNLTGPEAKNCIQVLVREVFEQHIDKDDL